MQTTMTLDMIDEVFRRDIAVLCELHRPSRHPFFARLAAYPTEKLRSSGILDELYTRYQAGMHASRAMGYFLPHLDSITLRVRKMRILAEDDGIPGGDTHHFQLRRTWTTMLGRPPAVEDDEFGELDELKKWLDPQTAAFITIIQETFHRSLGSWVMIEGLAHDWIGALLSSLTSHFPGIRHTDYFTENFANGLEVQHAQESMDLTASVLRRRPELLEETVEGARRMGAGLDILWSSLNSVITTSSKES